MFSFLGNARGRVAVFWTLTSVGAITFPWPFATALSIGGERGEWRGGGEGNEGLKLTKKEGTSY